MKNEEIVLDKLNNNRFLGKNPIHFDTGESRYYWDSLEYERYKDRLEVDINALKGFTEILDRVRKITKMHYNTYHENGRFQCNSSARRSTVDIWRIYKYYFGDIDLFSIMRALYQLVVDEDLNTYRCPDIRKRVYWRDSYGRVKNLDVKAELGVPLSEWENIGLNNET